MREEEIYVQVGASGALRQKLPVKYDKRGFFDCWRKHQKKNTKIFYLVREGNK